VISEEEIKTLVLPGPGEVLGIVEKLLGYDRLLVRCIDGHTRLCRIRGKMKRKVWIKEGDVVLVSPWDFQSETRGDVTWRYTYNQVDWLAKNKYIPPDWV
jgi:translation initiation factor 1A